MHKMDILSFLGHFLKTVHITYLLLVNQLKSHASHKQMDACQQVKKKKSRFQNLPSALTAVFKLTYFFALLYLFCA